MVVLVNMYYWKRVCTSVIVNVNVFVSITDGTLDEEVDKGVGGLFEVVAGDSLDGCTLLFGALRELGIAHDDARGIEVIVQGLALAQELG